MKKSNLVGFLVAITVVALMAGCGCVGIIVVNDPAGTNTVARSAGVVPPGVQVTVNFGWRSAQAGSASNVANAVEGGGAPSSTIPLK